MPAYKHPITLEEALREVTQERFCKGHHYKDVALTDAMVEQIVQVKSLVNVGFINTDITDEALQYLATLPKLKLLFLEDNKQATGEGFKYFAEKPIDHISLDGCPVTDETLPIVLQVPRLKSISLKRTRVTFEGLMAVAHYNKVSFYLDKPFTAEQIKAFEQAQRTAGKKKPAATPTDDLPIVKQLLLDFFAAMTEWERFASKTYTIGRETHLVEEKCKELFQKYCTEKRRAGYRPEAISYNTMGGGTYGKHKIIDSEAVTKNKIYLYTEDNHNTQFRFLIIRKEGEWKIDDCQWHDGGWTKYGL
ncbi:MAG: NTF2 fold immunity protein [Capnocytophaga sp.]|nr:NTF2 fold immunity protein [Capnocytophaga sp.]